MKRRQLITSTITLTAAGLAGCTGGGGGVVSSGPESIAKSYLQAYFNGNYEEARGYTTGVARDGITKQDVGEVAARETEIGDVVKNEQSNGEAVVSIVVTVSTALGDTTQTIDLLLVNQSGWQVTHSRTGFAGESKPAESGAFDSTIEGPVDVAFAYIAQGAIGSGEPSQYLTDSSVGVRDYQLPDSDTTIALSSHSQSDGSAEVVIDSIAAAFAGERYTHTLTQTDGEWLINQIEVGRYERGTYEN